MSDRVKNPSMDLAMAASASETIAAFRKIAATIPMDASMVTDEDKETAELCEVAYLMAQAVTQELAMNADAEQIFFRWGEGLGNILRAQSASQTKRLISCLMLGIEDGLSHDEADRVETH